MVRMRTHYFNLANHISPAHTESFLINRVARVGVYREWEVYEANGTSICVCSNYRATSLPVN